MSVIVVSKWRFPVNKINPKKLINSKWTAINPIKKEKHFVVTDVQFDEDAVVVSCIIEAVLTGRLFPILWQDLKDNNQWEHGWK